MTPFSRSSGRVWSTWLPWQPHVHHYLLPKVGPEVFPPPHALSCYLWSPLHPHVHHALCITHIVSWVITLYWSILHQYHSYFSIRQVAGYAYLVPVMLPMAQVGLTGSIYLTVAISIERYTTVVHPFFKVSSAYFCTPWSCVSSCLMLGHHGSISFQ